MREVRDSGMEVDRNAKTIVLDRIGYRQSSSTLEEGDIMDSVLF